MSLHLYDTLRRETIPFEPREEGRVSMYVCGPTVQAGPHVGHGRASVVFDVLRRWLEHLGHEVLYVENITDVDDKIIIRAQREGSSQARVATRYARVWNRTMRRLGVRPPDVQPFATGHILDMQTFIAELLDAGKAYEADGNVLFRVRSFDDYGRLSNRRVDDLQESGELVGAEHKKDPLDFALWKAAKEDEPSWPSPWGPGRPGWHIECSVMATRHLGGGFDIHGGGLDLVFPHHENEIAQYEALRGETFARWWVHNGMVQMGTEKMSKSIGNVVGLADALDDWGTGPVRQWYLSAHHRSPLVYEGDRLADAANAHRRMVTFLRTADLVLSGSPHAAERAGDDRTDAEVDETAAEPHRKAFADAMNDDLNVPRAIAALHELVSEGNDVVDRAEDGDEAARAELAALADTLTELGDDVLGLDLAAHAEASRARGRRIAPVVEHLLEQRADAREDGDFDTADRIRDELADLGVVVEDRPSGARWYVEPDPAADAGA